MLVCNLRNVNKTINTGNDASESTVCSHTNNGNLCSVANGVLVVKENPGVFISFFVTKRNLFLLGVNCFNINLNGIANTYNLCRVLNALPGKLRNMNHSINTADVNKCAIRSERFYCACENIANANALPKLCLSCFALLTKNAAD